MRERSIHSDGDDPRKAPGFGDLLARYVEQMQVKGFVDPDEVLAEHPELGSTILEDLDTYVQLRSEEPASEDAAPRKIGTLGDYTLRRQIGRGGMGVVYDAWQSSMDRRVALKVLPAGVAADTQTYMRFMREAKTAGHLNHPNVVHIHGMGVEEKTPYYAMEFVEGETLADILARIREAPADAETPFGKRSGQQFYLNVAEACAGVADGLHHAHSKKIVHRDIKPSNLILDTEGRLRILDFGLARLEGQETITLSGDVVGTPLYMSPEQARRKKVDVDYRTDIWSLGATMYEAVTGRTPFRGKDHQDTLSQIIERDPTDPSRLNPRVPMDLETIVMKCLRKEAAERFGTAEALGQDLRRFVRGEVIEARGQTKWERLVRRVRRHRIGLSAIAILFVLLGVIGWLAWRSASEAHLRALSEYRPKVLRALMKLQAGSINIRAEVGEPIAFDLRRMGFSLGKLGALSKDRLQPIEEAVHELGEAVDLLPERPDAWFHRARGCLLIGKDDEALRDIDRALHRAPSFVPAMVLRAAILERRGKKEQELSLREKAEKVSQDGWGSAWLAARCALRERQWNEAVQAFDTLIQLEADGKEAYLGSAIESCLGRAGARVELKDFAGALQDIGVARYLWPDSVEARLLEGRTLYLMGQPEKAIELFERTYEYAPYKDEVAIAVWLIIDTYLSNEAAALEWANRVSIESLRERFRASSLFYLGRADAAAEAARRAIALDPKDVWSYQILALTLYESMGKFEEALNVLRQAERLNPKDWYTHAQLGRLFWFWGKVDEAVPHYRRELELDPTQAACRTDLGICLILQGNVAEALELFDEAVAKDPMNTNVHNDISRGFSLLGRDDDALKACDASIRTDPVASSPRIWRAHILENKGRSEEAIEEYRHACPLSPHGPGPYLDLGRLLERQGRCDEAFAVYCEALDVLPANGVTLRRAAGLLRTGDAVISRAKVQAFKEKLPKIIEASARNLAERGPSAPSMSGLISTLIEALCAVEPGEGNAWSRLRVLQSLPPYAVIDGLLARDASQDLEGAEQALETFRVAVDSSVAGDRLQYLEAKVLERAARHGEAAAKLEELAKRDPLSEDVSLALALNLRASGDPQGAERALREAITKVPRAGKSLWDLWAAVELKELQRGVAELLADPVFIETGSVGNGEELRWLLERLRNGDPILINCGGNDYAGPDGRRWGRDRFALGGLGSRSYVGDIVGTDADILYQNVRWFSETEFPGAGYRIPLPPGIYKVSLHFAEVYWRVVGARSFDVLLEGRRALERFEPLQLGFATAHVESKVVEVEDGLLDIEFVFRNDAPMVSAIEIERAE